MIFKWRKDFEIATVIISNIGENMTKWGKKEGISEENFISAIICVHTLKDFDLNILKAFLLLFLSFIFYFTRITWLYIRQFKEF